jgi:hypothetical protein
MSAAPARDERSADESHVRIFVGAHAHEVLPLKVLEYSIKRHTRLAVSLRTVDNSLVAPPRDARFAAYTRFSYGRFAVPKLVGFRGRAIYMDSDMLVFGDIAEAWNTPFDGAKILVEKFTRRSRSRGRFTAFMLMDCAALRWDPDEIVAGLGHAYDYEELMSIYPLLAAGDLQDRLPLGWNSLDRKDAATRLLHFTRIRTQPWVYPRHHLGHFWVSEVRRMLADGALTADFVRAEVACGHLRPSLLAELGLDAAYAGREVGPEDLPAIDHRAGFVAHRDLREALRRREAARAARERELDPEGYARKERRRRWRRLRRHPIRALLGRF